MSIVATLRPRPGLRVLVSAGAAGIGGCIADAFVEAGAKVHVCDVDAAALDRFVAGHKGATGTLADVSQQGAVDQVFQDATAALGGLDVLVNNAGIAGPTGGIDQIQTAEWERTVDVNLNSQFYFAHRAVPFLKQSQDASIINIASVAGRLGYAYRTPYAATKWAIVGLTSSLAIELGPSGIRVNAVLPGIVEGERMNRVIQARADALGIPFEEMKEEYLQKISLRRMVTADDVAATILFLCSPGGRNISGQAISVDGNVEYL
jgi:NAD(P)-dependent dehydrogenase (short-subunit alcohol dehydrogenase family)